MVCFGFGWTVFTGYYTVVRRNMYLACFFAHRVQLPMLLLLCAGVVTAAVAAVRRHVPNVKIVADSLNLIPSRVFRFFIEARYFFHVCTLWQYCHICGLGLPILHPR